MVTKGIPIMRTSRFILPATLLVLALSACGGGTPDPGPTVGTPDATPAPTGEPAPDQATSPARIVVSTEGVQVFAFDDSILEEISIYDATPNAVADMTAAFGTEPAVSDDPGGMEVAPSRVYDWSGFTIIDYEGDTIMNTDFVFDVYVDAVADIEIVTYSGLQIGDPLADAVAVSDYETGFPEYTALGSVPIDPATVGEAGPGLLIYTGVFGPGGTISRIVAPSPNWGV
jgi:hypothetical protein